MKGLNEVNLIGRLGQDPEHKVLDSGTNVCNFTVATGDKYKNKQGEWVESTEWHNIVIWGKLAEIAVQYLKKGSQVFLKGSLKTDMVEKEGVKKYFTKIVARDMVMLDSKGDDLDLPF